MTRSQFRFVTLTCTLVLALAACAKGDDDDSGGGNTGTGGTVGGGTGGTVAGGTGGTVAGGTGGMAAGGAGMAAANMPNAQCIMGTTGTNPACDNCACTPNAMGGCLDEITACAAAADAMSAQLCKAVIDCAARMKCTGTDCTMPCMAEVTPAFMYMSGAPITAATNVGNCTAANCGSVCP